MPVVPGLFYKDYEPEIDRQVACALVREFAEHVPDVFMPDGFAEGLAEAGGVEEYVGRLFDRSALADSARLAALTALPRKEAVAALTADPAVEFYAMFADTYRQRISPVLEEADRTLAREYRTYMRGQMEFEPERNFYPDANLTLRVAYGAVEGIIPKTASGTCLSPRWRVLSPRTIPISTITTYPMHCAVVTRRRIMDAGR